MDYEKLIERLRTESLYKDKATLEIMDLCMEAADALSTLQIENQALRNAANGFKAENEKLRAELENYRKGHCAEGGCAAEKDRDAVLAELEQVKRCIEIVENQRDSAIKELENYMVQDVLDGNEPCAICAKASDTPCEYCNPKWRGQKED